MRPNEPNSMTGSRTRYDRCSSNVFCRQLNVPITSRDERHVLAGSGQLRSKTNTCATCPINRNAHLRPRRLRCGRPSAARVQTTRKTRKTTNPALDE